MVYGVFVIVLICLILQFLPSQNINKMSRKITYFLFVYDVIIMQINTFIYPIKKIEVSGGIDYVFAAYDEPPDDLYKELENCVSPNDRVFVYLKISSARTHAEIQTGLYKYMLNRKVAPNNIASWTNISTSFKKEINVIHTQHNDEFAGYLLHTTNHYYDMNQYTVFLHAHISSWHSARICSIVRNGLTNIKQSNYGFQNINYFYDRRCISNSTREYNSS